MTEPLQGYDVDYHDVNDDTSAFAHYFCGPHEVQGGMCPNCNKPLLRFLALDTQDHRLNLQSCPFSLLSLLFCWTCNVAQEPFYYKTQHDNSVSLIHYGPGGVEEDFPYEEYPIFFPGAKAHLVAISPEKQHVLSTFNQGFGNEGLTEDEYFDITEQENYNGIDKRGHQIGGEPYLVQSLRSLPCPICQTQMPFLASIRDNCLDDRGFTGDEDNYAQVLFHFCRTCHVIGAYQKCD